MGLDLVANRRDLRSLEQLLEILNGKVADADTPDLALFDELFQRGPCIRDRHIRETESLGHRIQWGESFIGVLECHGPMDLAMCESWIGLYQRDARHTRYRSR